MVEQRRAAFEAVSHAGDVDLYHQIVGEISVQVCPVCPPDEAVGRGEIRFEKIERRVDPLAHRLAIALLLVIIGEGGDRKAVTPAGLVFAGLKYRPDPGKFEPTLRRSWRQGQQPRERHPAPPRHPVEPRDMAHRLISVIAEKALVSAVAVERHGDVAARQLGDVIGRDRRWIGKGLAVMPY